MFGIMTRVVKGMTVNEDQMMENIGRSYYIFFSQELLLKLVQTGISREDAYRLVQRNAMSAFQERQNFREKVKSDPEITSLVPATELDALLSMDNYTRHVDVIFDRVYTSAFTAA